MSCNIFTPSNQARLTNVVVVRIKKGGKRFELACYPNKVKDWRDGVSFPNVIANIMAQDYESLMSEESEKDLDEVLQVKRVFTNVNKGEFAKKPDLVKVFGTNDEDAIIDEILKKGDLQVSEKERQKERNVLFSEIATCVAEKCINPETQKPITVSLVEKAMKDIHYSVKPTQSSKQQALKVIQLLTEKGDFPIQRAQMRLKIIAPANSGKKAKIAVEEKLSKIEQENFNESGLEIVALADPGKYREIEDVIRTTTREKGHVEILDHVVIDDSEVKFED